MPNDSDIQLPSPSPVKKIKLIFINMNMGGSEAAIAEKVTNKFKAKYPDLKIELEQHFYAGEIIKQQIEKVGKNDADLMILNSYGIKGSQAQMPYKAISDIPADIMKLKDAAQQDTIEVKILMSQTTDCGKYSLASQKIANNRKMETHAKQEKLEQSYFDDFQKAMTWNPDIVICENVKQVNSIAGAELRMSIKKTLKEAGLKAHEQVIEHQLVTATRRKRHYTIGTRFQITPEIIKQTLPQKDRTPAKYLFNVTDTEEKYASIKMKEKNLTKEPYKTEPKGFLFNDETRAALIKKIKLFLAFQSKKYSNKYIIILPNKIKTDFTTRKGKQREDVTLAQGLQIYFSAQMGAIYFLKRGGRRYERITLSHSLYPTETMTADIRVSFWDHGGVSPTIASLAKMQGMSKNYVEKLLELEPVIGIVAQKKALSHNLSPAVVGPFLFNLIEQQVFSETKTAEQKKTTKRETDKKARLMKDLGKDIVYDEYQIVPYLLNDGKHYVYYIFDKEGVPVDLEIILSDLPLEQLYVSRLIKDDRILTQKPVTSPGKKSQEEKETTTTGAGPIDFTEKNYNKHIEAPQHPPTFILPHKIDLTMVERVNERKRPLPSSDKPPTSPSSTNSLIFSFKRPKKKQYLGPESNEPITAKENIDKENINQDKYPIFTTKEQPGNSLGTSDTVFFAERFTGKQHLDPMHEEMEQEDKEAYEGTKVTPERQG